MSERANCGICRAVSKMLPSYFDGIHLRCPRCGEFKLTGRAKEELSNLLREDRTAGQVVQAKVSGWVYDQNAADTIPTISSDVLKSVSARPFPTVAERADRLLLGALRGQELLVAEFDIKDPRFLAATYSHSDADVDYLAGMLVEEGLVEKVTADGLFRIRPRGTHSGW